MSLRVKVECTLFLLLTLVVAFGFVVRRFVVIPELSPLEEQVAQKQMERAIGLLEAAGKQMADLCAEWSQRPEVSHCLANAGFQADSLWTSEDLTGGEVSAVCLGDV